jgi:hypothetical protein
MNYELGRWGSRGEESFFSDQWTVNSNQWTENSHLITDIAVFTEVSPDWNAETPIYQGIYYTLLDWKPLQLMTDNWFKADGWLKVLSGGYIY